MFRNVCLTTVFLLVSFYSVLCQEYSYTHYDISEGLAGSTVYCITQDKDGFIWVGTETGVSRFDGTNFKTFSTSDGLPDIEVLEMFGDSKGRVWMAPFSKTVCYYYKGKIHNQQNDPVLRKISLRSNVERFAEDAAGNILIKERTELHLVTGDGGVQKIDSIGGQAISQCADVCRSRTGHFLVREGDWVYSFSDSGFKPIYNLPMFDPATINTGMNAWGIITRSPNIRLSVIHSFVNGQTVILPFEQVHYKLIGFGVLDDSLFYFNEIGGASEYNLHTGRTKNFLPGKQVSRTFRDATGNLWFTTLGQGLFRLNSDEFRTVRLSTPELGLSSIYAIKRFGDTLVVGDNHNYIFELALPGMIVFRKGSLSGGSKNRIMDLDRMPNGRLLASTDIGFVEVPKDYPRQRLEDYPRIKHTGSGVKSLSRKSNDEFCFSSFWGVGVFNFREFRLKDTLWRERSSAVYCRADTVYVGTLGGLYAVTMNGHADFLGREIPFLRHRISCISESADGTLWIGSFDEGVVGYKGGRITAHFNRLTGLTSDLCRTLMIHNNSLWIGTEKGLNRVQLDNPRYPVYTYTSNDGLGSDIINSLYADSTVIYVGTPAGLSYFDETRVNSSEGCSLLLLSVVNSNKERIDDTANLVLPYTDKHLRLEFSGISFRSVGGITYRYRLIGLDTGWRETKQPSLEYLTLPSGKFQFQLQAINKFGRHSALLSLPFEVATPWWQTFWFYGLVLSAFLSIAWLIVTLRIRQIRRRQREKEQLSQRMMEMEHMALQAQMNPHFIFNCLNSIQQYIFDQDIFAANKYLTGFAKLIRATLQNSTKPFILLSEEISYLSGYLSLEKLRFKEKMDYLIEVDPALHGGAYLVPPMLIQPYVENSMRHGLRHKTYGKGLIQIRFRHEGTHLSVVVEDNGIGRKGAAAFKTREHIEYQSKGMSLTADRIRFINARHGDPIRVEVIDLEDDAGLPAGTRVVMKFPLFHLIFENETI